MRIKRTKKDFGGGSGREIFSSPNFRVVVWKLSGGIQTTIKCTLHRNLEIRFNGRHEFTSDNLCMQQFNVREILEMIKAQKEDAFEEGRNAKVAEIQRVLHIEGHHW